MYWMSVRKRGKKKEGQCVSLVIIELPSIYLSKACPTVNWEQGVLVAFVCGNELSIQLLKAPQFNGAVEHGHVHVPVILLNETTEGDGRTLADQREEVGAIVSVPEADAAIVAARQQKRSVVVKVHRSDGHLVTDQLVS